MIIRALQYLLGFGPFLLLVWYLAETRSLSLFKGVAAFCIFLGGAMAYLHFQDTGLFGLLLALAGMVCYLEEIRRDHFTEMKRLSENPPEEVPQTDAGNFSDGE